MEARIVLLAGDGIGPEVTEAAMAVLAATGEAFGHDFAVERRHIGGSAIDATGQPLPPETEACREADACSAQLAGLVGRRASAPGTGLLALRGRWASTPTCGL